MNIYMAPLEGITHSIFRSNQLKYFGGIDKYFAPFITPSEKGKLSTKIKRDLMPEYNKGQNLVPQILTNSSEGFITMCKSLEFYGYSEFNLNLGCPSGTVVSKGRGAGFLKFTDELNKFLNEIYSSDYKISVKTRIGMYSTDEFKRLLEIYNEYPMTELIIHPRTREEMYKGKPHMDIFDYAFKNSKNKLCYNGNIFTLEDYKNFSSKYPNINIMLGRGIVANPALPLIIKNQGELKKSKLYSFYESIKNDYIEIMSGETPVLYKLKEILIYMADIFEDNSKAVKHIKKSKKLRDIDAAFNELMDCSLKEDL